LVIQTDYLTERPFEIIEKKGMGHPDTLADNLAEFLSAKYSNYTRKKYGAILHHNFDKIALLGGSSFVTFGKGYLTSPIRVILNGRASTKFGQESISVDRLLIEWSKDFFRKCNCLYGVDIDKDLRFILELSNQSSPGKTHSGALVKKASRRFWFEPRSLEDLPELKRLFSNDTSLGVGYAPLSSLEKFVLNLEKYLNSQKIKKQFPWMGTDIKIMAVKIETEIQITLCIPQIADYVHSIEDYKRNVEECFNMVKALSLREGINLSNLAINTRDDYKVYEIYLTATGSSLESGDEGLVGRGNRITKLISPLNPYSMEGFCGKNPVYHIGKLYYLAAQILSEDIYIEFHIRNQVFLASQSGRDLIDPWVKVIVVPVGIPNEIVYKIEQKANRFIKKIPLLTEKLVAGTFQLA